MILYIDTTDFSRAVFALSGGKLLRKKIYNIDPYKSHEILAKLGEFLKSNKVKTSGIKKIIVHKGPGSFTGVRVGVTIVMALGFAWGAKVSALNAADFSRMITRINR